MTITDKFFRTLGALGNDGVHFAYQSSGAGASVQVIDDPTGSGYGLVAKFSLTPGDVRSELSGDVDRDPTFETEYWTRWGVYIPSIWRVSSESILFLQIHETADTSPADVSGRAQLIGYVQQDQVVIANAYCASSQTASLSAITNRVLTTWPLSASLGRWTDIVLRSKWSYSGTGNLEVYRNQRRVFCDVTGSNAFNNSPARGGNDAYHKLGIYNDSGSTAFSNYVLHRGVVRGTGYASLAGFLADHDPSVQELEQETLRVGGLF